MSKSQTTWLMVSLTAYCLFFFFLAVRKYVLFTDNAADTAIIQHAFWGSIHGKFFPCFSLEMSFFGDKASYILILLWPIYWLFPSTETLLFLQSIFITLAGVPIYFIALRSLRDHFAALAITFAFLLFPTIVSQHVNTIHDTQFIVVFLLWAFYFYEGGDFRLFALFCGLSCLGKENVPLTIMVFGVYAALQRRSWRWVVLPILMGAVTMLAEFKWLMPWLRNGKPYRSFTYFGELGQSPMDVVRTAITRPLMFARVLFSGDRIMYLIQLLEPVGLFLPFVSLAVIFILPDLVLNLLVENAALRVIRWHYNLTVGAFLFVALIFSIRKIVPWLERRYGAARYATGFGILFLCLSTCHWVFWLNLNDYQQPPQYAALQEALAMVPESDSVLAPQTMIAHVANRWHFTCLSHVLINERAPENIFKYKFVILDLNERRPTWNVPQEVVRAFGANPDYELVFNQQNVLVFRRKGEDILVGKPAW